jgi:hypothetical protein
MQGDGLKLHHGKGLKAVCIGRRCTSVYCVRLSQCGVYFSPTCDGSLPNYCSPSSTLGMQFACSKKTSPMTMSQRPHHNMGQHARLHRALIAGLVCRCLFLLGRRWFWRSDRWHRWRAILSSQVPCKQTPLSIPIQSHSLASALFYCIKRTAIQLLHVAIVEPIPLHDLSLS